MNIPKEILEKAIEGGWNSKGFNLNEWGGEIMHDASCIIALDPSFWSALGKAFGWEKGIDTYPYKNIAPFEKAHKFYDLILTGGDTDSFWQEVLQTK